MDNNQYQELVSLILDNKAEVKKQALMICLQYSNTSEDRKSFMNTEIIKNILKLFGDEELHSILLSLIISFSQDEFYQQQLLDSGYILRQNELIKQIIFKIYNQKQGNGQDALIIQLSLLALNNLTQNDLAKDSFLQLEHHDINRCFYFRLFCNFFIDPRSSEYFFNFKQILLNVTASVNVRQELIKEDLKMIEYFVKLLESGELYSIQIMKNMLFEYESQQIIDKIKGLSIIDKILDFLALNMVDNYSLFDLEQNELAFQLAVLNFKKIQCNSVFQERIGESLKCLLILTNLDFKQLEITYNRAKLDLICGHLRKLKNLIDNDALEVIETVYIKAQ